MNKVMAWVKANVWIVVLSAVIVVVLPASWFGTAMWNKSIREARQKAVADDQAKLKSVEHVSYTLKAVVPNEPPLEFPWPPNEKAIELFTQLRAAQDEQISGVLKMAQEMNSRGHAPLIDGLFPQPAEAERQTKVLAFVGTLVPTKDTANPSAYERLLASIGAGGPPDPAVVLQGLNDAKQRELERHKAGGNTPELTETEQKDLTRTLVNQRLASYKQRAEQLSVYAAMDMFPKPAADSWPKVPEVRPQQPPRIDTCFTLQCDYWTVQDVLGAVKLANTGQDGSATTVPGSVVKRIESLRLGPPPWQGGSEGEQGGSAGGDPKTALIPVDYNASVTGRVGGKNNQLYDVRRAHMTAIVELARMPQFFNAISHSNFMTVIGVSLRPVDINSELESGYFYGREAVVRADIDIEVVWLRNWTVPFMPDDVKSDLGIKSPESEKPAEQPANKPAPPPPPSGPSPKNKRPGR